MSKDEAGFVRTTDRHARALMMAPVLVLAALCADAATTAHAAAPEPDVLTDDEGLTMCAEQLPKQLACKQEFCAAMVQMRAPNADKATASKLEAKCREEIAVDGGGDLAARKDRCAAWAKQRPKLQVKRTLKNEMDACWTKPACESRVACWAPKMRELMTSAAPVKKGP